MIVSVLLTKEASLKDGLHKIIRPYPVILLSFVSPELSTFYVYDIIYDANNSITNAVKDEPNSNPLIYTTKTKITNQSQLPMTECSFRHIKKSSDI